MKRNKRGSHPLIFYGGEVLDKKENLIFQIGKKDNILLEKTE